MKGLLLDREVLKLLFNFLSNLNTSWAIALVGIKLAQTPICFFVSFFRFSC